MKKKLLLLAGIVSGTLFSCTFEEVLESTPSIPTSKTEVIFSSSIIQSNSTYSRILGENWEPGDAIGIYMLNKKDDSVVERKSNVRYVTDKGGYIGNFMAKDNSIFFPKDGSAVRFMSYYPYKESTKGTIYNIDVTNQIRQSDLDFLYSFDTSETYNKNSEKVPMRFNRQLAKIFINVKNGEGLKGSDLMNMKVYLSGFSTNADFNLLTGKISNFTKSSLISPSVRIAGGGYVYSAEAVVIPESNIPNGQIIFNMNNGNKNKKSDVYIWNLENVLGKGKSHTYNVKISNTGISVNSIIHNWHSVNVDESVGFE